MIKTRLKMRKLLEVITCYCVQTVLSNALIDSGYAIKTLIVLHFIKKVNVQEGKCSLFFRTGSLEY